MPQNQNEWDPTAKLVELQRRQSEVLEKGPTSPPRQIPLRGMIGSAVCEVGVGRRGETGEEGEEVRMATLEEARSLPGQPVPVPVVGTLDFSGGEIPVTAESESVAGEKVERSVSRE